jgi:hypothetical protein
MAYLIALVALMTTVDKTWSFAADAVNEPPRGFYFDTTDNRPKGKWQVIADGDRRVVAQLDASRDARRLALAVVKDVKLENVRLSCRIKVVSGMAEQSAGILWRYKDSENYLMARLDTGDKNVRLYRVVRGHRVRFGGQECKKLKVDGWYTLRIEHRGDKIKVYLDDEMLFDERDRHFTAPGKIGLWTKGDSIAYFSDLRVQELNDE